MGGHRFQLQIAVSQQRLTTGVGGLNHDVLDVVAAVTTEDVDQALLALHALGRDGAVVVLLSMADEEEGRLGRNGGRQGGEESNGELHVERLGVGWVRGELGHDEWWEKLFFYINWEKRRVFCRYFGVTTTATEVDSKMTAGT